MRFPIYNNEYPKYCQDYKKDVWQWNLRLYLYFLRNTVTIQQNAWKEKIYYFFANKLIELIPDHLNAKEHDQSFLRKKDKKSVKQTEIITYQPKTFEKPNIADMKNRLLQNI